MLMPNEDLQAQMAAQINEHGSSLLGGSGGLGNSLILLDHQEGPSRENGAQDMMEDEGQIQPSSQV